MKPRPYPRTERCSGSLNSGEPVGRNPHGWPLVRCSACGAIVAVIASSHMEDNRAQLHQQRR